MNLQFQEQITIIAAKKSRLIYIPKRKMHTLTHLRNLIYRGNIHKNAIPAVETQFARSHTNWTGGVRVANAKYNKNPPKMDVDPETKLEIMRPYDASGKNHYLLIDDTFKHHKYYLVKGSFTTSSTSYNDIPPDMVAGFTLEGHFKPQFLQRYDTPRLIEKSHVVMHSEATVSLQSPEYLEYLDTLPSKNS